MKEKAKDVYLFFYRLPTVFLFLLFSGLNYILSKIFYKKSLYNNLEEINNSLNLDDANDLEFIDSVSSFLWKIFIVILVLLMFQI